MPQPLPLVVAVLAVVAAFLVEVAFLVVVVVHMELVAVATVTHGGVKQYLK